jgi:tetratricopeptide (TPR) repeat protein
LDTGINNRLTAPRVEPATSKSVVTYLTWLVTVLIVIVAGLLIVSLVGEPPAPRTSAERNLARFEELVKKDPKDSGAQAGMGVALMDIGAYDQAITYLKKALKLEGNNARYQVTLAEAYAMNGQDSQALKTLADAKRINGRFEDAWYLEGKIYYDQENYKKAIDSLMKVVEINPNAADTLYLVASAYEKSGNVASAKIYYQKALEYIPDFIEAQEALQRLEEKH